MQLSNKPAKLVLPFANAGSKNTIPVASQIGITPGAASFTDGFPPLTRTPLTSGGVPPSGLDMNGVLFDLTAISRWLNAGGSFIYDSTFANDADIGGYPAGAILLRSDGDGFWLNLADNNVTDPESAGAAAAGWVPAHTYGMATVAMASANVTLTPLQYGRPVILITGTLTANLNLIFPHIVGEWAVINQTTGAYAITCKTSAGTGVTVDNALTLVGDGTNIYNAVSDLTNNALHGQCELSLSGGNLVLSPKNGNKLIIAGVSQTIPSAGVSLAATGATPSTTYYIYAYMNAGVMTLEYSTTGHSTDTTTGVEIKTGDATRTLVGQARAITGPAWVNSSTQRFVRSWFNEPFVYANVAGTSDVGTTNTPPYAEISTSRRVEFLVWGTDKVESSVFANAVSPVAGVLLNFGVGVDSTSTPATNAEASDQTDAGSASVWFDVAAKNLAVLSEGYHYVTQLANESTGQTVTWKADKNFTSVKIWR